SAAIPEDADKGDKISLTVGANVSIDNVTVIAKGARGSATISEGARKKILGRRSDITMLFDTVETIDGKQVRLREVSLRKTGADRKPRAAGKMSGATIPAGTQYVAYIDGDVTVSVKR